MEVLCLHEIISVRVRGDTKVAASYRDILSLCLSCLSFAVNQDPLRFRFLFRNLMKSCCSYLSSSLA